MRNRKGFTLIEMLVVIAVIAVLVAIVVPTVTSATAKAKAATDAANLRMIQGTANTNLVGSDVLEALGGAQGMVTESKSFPNAHVYLAYGEPGFIKIYFVDGDNYYGLEYFSDVAQKKESSQSTSKPDFPYDVEWYDLTNNTKVS